jgi:hypothetical protein
VGGSCRAVLAIINSAEYLILDFQIQAREAVHFTVASTVGEFFGAKLRNST